MILTDTAIITVQAGNGGSGCLSFRREKFIPYGGPDGGDGGDGGNVYLIGKENVSHLSTFKNKVFFKASNGQSGEGKSKKGKSAEDLFINVPLGTECYNFETNELIGEIIKNKQILLVAKAGFHGLGNIRFKSSINRAPRTFTKGSIGEVRKIKLELKVLADVGLVGKPNAGKSSLMAKISNAKPKIANYPFSTIHPNLGTVNIGFNSFVIADIPGLIKNANKGSGLGTKFLKHLSRVKMLVHILDIMPEDKSDPVDNYYMICKEIEKFDININKKTSLLVLNKIDMIDKSQQEKVCNRIFTQLNYKDIKIIISALTGQGCENISQIIYDKLQKIN